MSMEQMPMGQNLEEEKKEERGIEYYKQILKPELAEQLTAENVGEFERAYKNLLDAFTTGERGEDLVAAEGFIKVRLSDQYLPYKESNITTIEQVVAYLDAQAEEERKIDERIVEANKTN